MSDIAPRPKRTPRRVREKRAYNLAVTGGVTALGAVAATVLAIVGIVSLAYAVLLACIAALCFVLFKRIVS